VVVRKALRTLRSCGRRFVAVGNRSFAAGQRFGPESLANSAKSSDCRLTPAFSKMDFR
jgi:hypothetical protein